jgi:hypothetical protein
MKTATDIDDYDLLKHAGLFNRIIPLDYENNQFELVRSDNDNIEPLYKLKGYSDSVNDRAFMSTWLSKSLELAQPYLFHLQTLFKEELDTISQRQVYDQKFNNMFKSDVRYNEIAMVKLKKCLETGQIKRFVSLSKEHLSLAKLSPCSNQIESVMAACSYLERIQILHQQGYSTDKREARIQEYDFSLDPIKDWTLPMLVAASLDSSDNVKLLDALIKRLKQDYDANLHRLALKLASCLALKSALVPLELGIHPLPQDLEILTKRIKKEEADETLKMWLNKLVSSMDRPLDKEPNKWGLLRTLMLKLLKRPDRDQVHLWFIETFDPMRVKVWLKIHFGHKSCCDFELFKEELWIKLFSPSSLITDQYKDAYDKFEAVKLPPKVPMVNKEILPTNELPLSATKSAKPNPNYNVKIMESVNLNRDVGTTDHLDPVLRLHVTLKYIEEKSLVGKYLNKNIQFASKMVNSSCSTPQDEIDEKVLFCIAKMKTSSQESIARMFYERNATLIPSRYLEFLKDKSKFKSKSESKSKAEVAAVAEAKSKANSKLANAVQAALTNNLSLSPKQCTQQFAISHHIVVAAVNELKRMFDYKPFLAKLNNLKSDSEKHAQSLDIPENIMKLALELLGTYARKPFTLETCLFSVLAQHKVKPYIEIMLKFLFDHFEEMMFNNK